MVIVLKVVIAVSEVEFKRWLSCNYAKTYSQRKYLEGPLRYDILTLQPKTICHSGLVSMIYATREEEASK